MHTRALIAAAGLAVGFCGASALLAGDLNPPPGPITPTMKSLDSIAPGVCVNDLPGSATAVHVITQPGVYFLRAPIDGQAGKHGIVIDFSALPPGEHDVTIDLGGFPLTGVTGSFDGIHSSAAGARRLVLIAGSVGAGSAVVGDFDGDGLHVEGASSVVIDGVHFDSNGGDGFEVEFASDASPQTLRCSGVVSHGGGGAGGLIRLAPRAPSSVSLEDVVCTDNGAQGLLVSWSQSAGPGGRRHSLDSSRCTMSGNGSHGVLIDGTHRQSADMSMDADGLSCSENNGSGFSVVESVGLSSYSFDGCTFSDNVLHGADLRGGGGGNHPNVVHFIGCVASENGQHGLVSSATRGRAQSCDASDNVGDGFVDLVSAIEPRDVLKSYFECRATGNGGAGFRTADGRNNPDKGNNINWSFCTASENGGNGFQCDESRASMDHCDALNNGGDGVQFHTTTPGHKYVDTITLRCSGNLGSGMSVDGGEASLDSCAFDNNGFGPAGGDGLRMSNTRQVSKVTVRGWDNFRHGATLTNCGTVTVIGGEFRSNGAGPVGGSGLFIQGAPTVSLEGVRFISNTNDNLYIADTNNNRVQHCSSSGAGGAGMVIENTIGLPCGVVSVEDSSFTQNAGAGMLVSCSTGGAVSRCLSAHNGGNGFVITGFGHVVTGNTSAGNAGASFIVPVPGNSLGPVTTEAGMATAPCTANFER